MRLLVTRLLPVLVTLICCSPAFCQSMAATAAPTPAADIALIEQRYAAAFPNHPQLYNGPEYVNYALRYSVRTGHQFFLWPEKQPGSVDYNGKHFSDLSLAYDIVLDQLVLPFPNSPFMLRLLNENMSSFTINDHYFVRVVADSAKDSPITTGYYEILNDGRVQVLAKRSKRLQEQIRQSKLAVEFSLTDKLFLAKGGNYYPVSTKRATLRVFSDRAKELQTYIQVQNLKFSKTQLEVTLVELANQYNTLTAK